MDNSLVFTHTGNMIKIRSYPLRVAFDIGNVICHVDISKFCEFVVQKDLAKDIKSAEDFLNGIQHPQDLGLYNIRQGFYRFNPRLSNNVLQEIHDAWINTVQPSVPMLDLIDNLLSTGYQVALLSNIGYDHASVVRQQCKVFQRCIQHFSCDVGARKPTKLFYQSFILEQQWANNVLFFDDRDDNVKAAAGYLTGVNFDLDNFNTDEEAALYVRNLLKEGE